MATQLTWPLASKRQRGRQSEHGASTNSRPERIMRGRPSNRQVRKGWSVRKIVLQKIAETPSGAERRRRILPHRNSSLGYLGGCASAVRPPSAGRKLGLAARCWLYGSGVHRGAPPKMEWPGGAKPWLNRSCTARPTRFGTTREQARRSPRGSYAPARRSLTGRSRAWRSRASAPSPRSRRRAAPRSSRPGRG